MANLRLNPHIHMKFAFLFLHSGSVAERARRDEAPDSLPHVGGHVSQGRQYQGMVLCVSNCGWRSGGKGFAILCLRTSIITMKSSTM